MICLLSFAAVVNLTMWNLPSEPISWLPLAVAEVEEGLGRISAGRMTSSVSASRTPPGLLACMWMILWPQSLKTLQLLLDFCPLSGPPRALPNPPLEGSSPATEAELLSTIKLVSSLHHSQKGFCCPVGITCSLTLKKHILASTQAQPLLTGASLAAFDWVMSSLAVPTAPHPHKSILSFFFKKIERPNKGGPFLILRITFKSQLQCTEKKNVSCDSTRLV